MSEDLRTLAQAVVEGHSGAAGPFRDALGTPDGTVAVARAILAVDAQGYARAMGEVEARCSVSAPNRAGGPRERLAHHAAWRNALAGVAEWARERADAAERDYDCSHSAHL